jgi:predicted DNA-binding transcriptional regulator AlpA
MLSLVPVVGKMSVHCLAPRSLALASPVLDAPAIVQAPPRRQAPAKPAKPPKPPKRVKLQDALAYPPRLLRAERAAAYLAMGERTFLRLVDEGKLPKPKRLGGVVAWDRYRRDACIDDGDDDVADNSVDRLLRERDD